MLRRSLAIATVIAGLATVAIAQSKGPNGGMISGTGDHKTELVVSPTELTVYLLHDGKAHDTKGATLRAVVQQDGKTTNVSMADRDGKRMVGKLPAPLAKGAIVVVTGKDDHGDAINARYVIP
jgi:cytochrome c-type biogenesis protein CcmE